MDVWAKGRFSDVVGISWSWWWWRITGEGANESRQEGEQVNLLELVKLANTRRRIMYGFVMDEH